MDRLEIGTRLDRPERSGAISQLFVAHHRRLVGLASLLVDDRETAEDVVQEAFAGLYARWPLLRDHEAAVAYLNRTVVNGGRGQLRHRHRGRVNLTRMTPRPEELDSAEQVAVGHDEAALLWQAVVTLPWRQRQVLVLRYYLDQSEAEIANTLGVSPGSVKKHASRGLATLARRWEARS
ncbi:MAG: SigE family RNA polymerase sigma factor [Nocardioides sp.]|uniref:SigE family RNA polymerase sigma factor n=1 Tax=Nocardioides sp. TaxID=35761 RepID=UPI003267282A